MLFERELGLVVNVYMETLSNSLKRFKKIDMISVLTKERKWNQIKCLIKFAKGRKSRRKTGTKNNIKKSKE